ncbi:MAG: hypothetical protein IPL36_09795 [Nigerium sp.]|nr:hypothetical protein [Nigerium sp.]
MKSIAVVSPSPDPAAGWSNRLRIAVGGQGLIAHAGVVLPRLLADRIGLTAGLRWLVARRGFDPRRDRGRLLTDAVAALVAGASCLSDVEALTRQEALFGPGGGASDTTVLRALDELAAHLGTDGLPDGRWARMLAEVRGQGVDAGHRRQPGPAARGEGGRASAHPPRHR